MTHDSMTPEPKQPKSERRLLPTVSLGVAIGVAAALAAFVPSSFGSPSVGDPSFSANEALTYSGTNLGGVGGSPSPPPPSPPPPSPPPPSPPPPSPPPPSGTIVLVNRQWVCRGAVNLDLVKVTRTDAGADAISLAQNCTGRIGRVEVVTNGHDGIKVQNTGSVAHDLVIGSGYVRCTGVADGAHQDGVQAMGGYRITARGLSIDCLRNSNWFIARGGSGSSTPTDIVCEGCFFGGKSGSTTFLATSIRSGVRDSLICTGRNAAIRIERATSPVNVGNTILPRSDPRCASG